MPDSKSLISSSRERLSISLFAKIAVLTAALWLIWPFLVVTVVPRLSTYWGDTPFKLEQLGQVGDLFGGINAFFTAIALAAVWWTGHMQRESLVLQREELAAQRIELEENRRALGRQTFEPTFFQMMVLLRDLAEAFSEGNLQGKKAMASMAQTAQQRIAEQYIIYLDTERSVRSGIGDDYEKNFYKDREPSLGPYFRALYNTLKLIDQQSYLDEEHKITYANIIRSQLNSHALILLSYNGCSDRIAKNMRKYIEKYRLLKHIPDTFKEVMMSCCDRTAFEDRQEI